MGATLLTLRDEVKFRLGRPGDADLTDARYNSRINWTIQNLGIILRLREFEEQTTRVLVPSVGQYLLADDTFAIRSVKVIEEEKSLDPISLTEDAYEDEAVTGEPQNYLREGNVIFIRPAPSSSYLSTTKRLRFYYWLTAPVMVGDAEVSLTPDWADEGVVLGAIYRVLRDRNEFERAQFAFRDWVGWIRSIRDSKGLEFQFAGHNLRTIGAGSYAQSLRNMP